MGTFALTAVVDYCLLFANQGQHSHLYVSVRSKLTEFAFYVYCLQQINRSCPFLSVLFSASRIPETWRHGYKDIETWIKWRHGDMDMETWIWRHGHRDMELNKLNEKRKPKWLSWVRLLFAHRANGSLSFVRLLTKQQTEVIHLQTD
jgi:hypothetical protein